MTINLSVHDLIARQVAALISATADAIRTEGESILELEANLYEGLAVNCAHKYKLAASFAEGAGTLAKTKGPGWRLWTRDETVNSPTDGWDSYDTQEQALRAACEKMKLAHKSVLKITGPDGQEIELEAIKHWCDAQPQ